MKKIIASLITCSLVCVSLAACSISAQSSASSKSSATPNNQSAQTIELNQTVKTDDYELTLTSVEWTDEIKERTSENSFWTFNASNMYVSGETMLVVRGTFKNLSGSKYPTSAIDVNFRVNDKYDLSGEAKSNNSSINPLSTENVFFCAATSNEMKDTFKDGTMTLRLMSCTYEGDLIRYSNDLIGEYTLKIAA